MWRYENATGRLLRDNLYVATGYSGKGTGKNNPEMENVHRMGPIPKGIYDIGPPHDTTTHGPYVMDLTPHPDNEMYGRDLFRMHGDSISNPGLASEGCIIEARPVREQVGKSGDTLLEVV